MLTIGNTDSDLKVHELHHTNELLVRSDFPFKNVWKLAQHTETIRKNCLGKEVWRVLVADKSTDHDNHISIFPFLCFFTTILTSKQFFFQSASSKRHCATHWREQRGWDRKERRVQRLDYVHSRALIACKICTHFSVFRHNGIMLQRYKYYASIMPDAPDTVLCSKLCRHNPTHLMDFIWAGLWPSVKKNML